MEREISTSNTHSMADNFPPLPDSFFLYLDDIDINLTNDNGKKQDVFKQSRSEQLPKLLFDRNLSLPKINSSITQKRLEVTAEENLLKKDLMETCCTIPGNPKSTFLMVFSPDGSKVASSHGDHNINVTDLRTKKCITTLTGHPRTPWCIAFHPHRNDILASGCLGGQVRVWDLHGGSEMWSVTNSEVTTVIASLAFHPSDRLLVIATNSTLYFWDWNVPHPFARCSTANEKQKLRYVSFDPLGNWLLTGISNAPGSVTSLNAGVASSTSSLGPTSGTSGISVTSGLAGFQRAERLEQERERNLQNRYQILLDQYERLRVRYQELRHRAAELELNASPNQPTNTATNSEVSTEPGAARSTNPSVPESPLFNGSPSDQFWRTLMNAAENLRELSNIGRSLNSSSTSNNAGPSRAARPSLDHDARIRIQLLSRHIEDMQRICLSHIEVTRHRRQVYRLQQIRRILEDLREQIRYLQDCVRDSLDLVTRLRVSPSPTLSTPSSVSTNNVNNNSGSTSEQPLIESPSPSTSGHLTLAPEASFSSAVESVDHRTSSRSRMFSPIQYRRYTRFLMGRLRRIGSMQEREQLRRSFGRNTRFSLRRLRLNSSDRLSPPSNPVEQIEPPQGASRDSPNLGNDLGEESSLERDLGFNNQSANISTSSSNSTNPSSNSSMGLRRSRFVRQLRRSLTLPRNNTLLHMRNTSLTIQRRKPTILSRVLQGRALQHQLRVASNLAPVLSSSSDSQAPTQDASRRLADQSLRPLMERLESHFRLQRQTLGILAHLNDSSENNPSSASSAAALTDPSSIAGPSNATSSSYTAHLNEGSNSSPVWANSAFRNVRHWRSRRDPLERGLSLDSRTVNSGVDRFPPPRRVPGSLHFPPPYRTFVTHEEDDSSDTDTDLISESSTTHHWRQSSPIRSPRGVEQRMRLLWREYLSQVVNAQGPSSTDGQPGGEQNDLGIDSGADQERMRYRMWLSTMVESLTSFFSQHGIHSSEPDPPVATSGVPPAVTTPPRPPPLSSGFQYVSRMGHAAPSAVPDEGPLSPVRPGEQPHWRIFPRVGIVMGASGAHGVNVSTSENLTGQQRWNMRRNAESQVSLSAHLTYRIQAWSFNTREGTIPDISDTSANIVVRDSKIHNDASVDVSSDGRFLVTLIPCTSFTGACVSVHSLESSRLGDCLAQVNVDQFVVSVSISPTCRHLLLGLASSRAVAVANRDPSLPTLWAKVFEIPLRVLETRPKTKPGTIDVAANDPKLAGAGGSSRTGVSGWREGRSQIKHGALRRNAVLPLVREIRQTTDIGSTSLNCIRWIPTAGQGLVLGTNKGHLKVIN